LVVFPTVFAFWFGAATIMAVFAPAPEVLQLAVFALKVAGLGYLLTPFELVMTGLAQGLKQPKYALLVNVLRLLLLRIPLALVFLRLWGGRGIYLSHPLSATLSGLAGFLLLRRLLQAWREVGCLARESQGPIILETEVRDLADH
ncbi:MAG: hypothetical protein JXR89_07645, partial [Deltaproteobacteria bacterium]|nr:hypothetical protein [Deltaproteobacteria bacterium]